MSILHRALKKAEKDAETGHHPQAMLVDAESGGGSANRRVFLSLLVLILIAVAGFGSYLRWGKGRLSSASRPVSLPVAAPTESGLSLLDQATGFMHQEKYQEARSLLEKALVLGGLKDRETEAYNNLGLVLRRLGRTEEAFTQFRKALDLSPQCAECLNNMGVLYMTNHDLGEAENRFNQAIEMKPDFAEPHLHLAMVEEARGNLTQAREHFAKFADLARGVGADFLVKVQDRISSLGGP